jgi:hypothetical protein
MAARSIGGAAQRDYETGGLGLLESLPATSLVPGPVSRRKPLDFTETIGLRAFPSRGLEPAVPLTSFVTNLLAAAIPEFAHGIMQSNLARQNMEDHYLESAARRGEAAVLALPSRFRDEHAKDHVAVSLNGRVLAVAHSLAELNSVLVRHPPSEDYYVAQVGEDDLATIE